MDECRATNSQLLLLLLLLYQQVMWTERCLLVMNSRVMLVLWLRFVRHLGVAASKFESQRLRHVRVETFSLHSGTNDY